ncbi:MAG: 1-acyl-sn-glycerol-3-phosphate acyltransferase, partial [Spirochaetia bacterium]|nr:1-acyl-sn-glycerol-3-phosphate acyltransferase [Spirochaetia bacterium]
MREQWTALWRTAGGRKADFAVAWSLLLFLDRELTHVIPDGTTAEATTKPSRQLLEDHIETHEISYQNVPGRHVGHDCHTLKIEGKENLPKEPSFLLINHQSNMDAFILGSTFPRHSVVIAKKEMMKVPLFGLILKASRTILVDRDDAASAKKAIKDCVRAVQVDKNNIWIFQEGTRSHGKGLGEFKKGAFVMAIAAQAPIICIVNQPMEHVLDTV